MTLALKDLLPMLVTVGLAIGSTLTYLQLNFATAADVQQMQDDVTDIKAMMLADSIQRKMWRMCEDPQNAELARMIEKMRNDYHILTGDVLGWVCTP